MIEINGLTRDQYDMLDMMWSLDTEEDYLNWYECLDSSDQSMADLLMRMIILAEVDNVAMEDDLSQAKDVLKKFALH